LKIEQTAKDKRILFYDEKNPGLPDPVTRNRSYDGRIMTPTVAAPDRCSVASDQTFFLAKNRVAGMKSPSIIVEVMSNSRRGNSDAIRETRFFGTGEFTRKSPSRSRRVIKG